MISKAALAALKASNPCDKIASKWVQLRKLGVGYVGPCPLHSPNPQARDSTSFECDADGWVCARCENGGDVIRLVMLRQKVDFRRAVEILGGAIEPDPASAAELELNHVRRQAATERQEKFLRQRPQQAIIDIWSRASALYGSSAQIYLQEKRRLLELPADLQLRCIENMPYYANGARDIVEIHVGPCMIAPIVDAGGGLRGAHLTYLDLDQPNGKAVIRDAETGHPLPAKKVRGTKSGNVIRLVQTDRPIQLVIGEGIETVLSVWLALRQAGRDLSRTSFWSAIDLGNLAGKATGSVPHPVLREAAPIPVMFPGRNRISRCRASSRLRVSVMSCCSEMETATVLPPNTRWPEQASGSPLPRCANQKRSNQMQSIIEDPALTIEPPRVIRVAWAHPGSDFNDMLRDGLSAQIDTIVANAAPPPPIHRPSAVDQQAVTTAAVSAFTEGPKRSSPNVGLPATRYGEAAGAGAPPGGPRMLSYDVHLINEEYAVVKVGGDALIYQESPALHLVDYKLRCVAREPGGGENQSRRDFRSALPASLVFSRQPALRDGQFQCPYGKLPSAPGRRSDVGWRQRRRAPHVWLYDQGRDHLECSSRLRLFVRRLHCSLRENRDSP